MATVGVKGLKQRQLHKP